MILSGLCLSLAGFAVWKLAPTRLVSVPKLWAHICLGTLRLFCGIKITVTGREHLPPGAALIAAQHQSALDILIWLAVLPNPALVFKQELDRIPLFGTLLRPAGMIAVNRSGGANALRQMVADSKASLAAGRQIVIFPEGTRLPPGQRTELHPGVVAIAKAAAAPIIPATTNSGRRWPPRAFLKTPGPVTVTIHPALTPTLRREEVLTELGSMFYGQESK
jgi:1-acyl-sn-glycerol-3-phosphate acyltransferase